MKVMSAHVAAVADPEHRLGLLERLGKSRGGFVSTALLVATLSVGLLSFVGLGHVSSALGFGLDRLRNRHVANRQMAVLAEEYKVPVASILGIDPDSVTTNDLELAAQVNPQIAGVIAKVKDEKTSNNRAAMAMAAAGATVGFIPGAQMITNTVGHGVMHMGAGIAGDLGAHVLLDKDILEPLDAQGHIDAKLAAGQVIVAADFAMLRIAQDPELQKEIKKNAGTAFHKMKPAEQQVLMGSMPQLLEAATYDAGVLNRDPNPRTKLPELVMHSPGTQRQQPSQGGWAARVGGSRGAQGAYAAQVRAQQIAAAQQGKVVT